MTFRSKPKIFTTLSAIVLLLAAGLFTLTRQSVKKLISPYAQTITSVAIPSPTIKLSPSPTASPTTTPTPKPLTFAEMNALYGPCAYLPVLMYHHVQDAASAKQNGNGNLTVYPDVFEKQLAYLQSKGYQTIDPADLIAFFNSSKPLPKKSVLLTFDDGYSDFASFAAPLLTKYSFKGIIFIPTGLMNNPGYLSWSTIQSLSGGNFYFANHTWSHQSMGGNKEIDTREINTADKQLAEKGLNQLKIFAYPYGGASQIAITILKNEGYQLAFTTVPGQIQCAKQRLSLPRTRIGNTPLSYYGL